METDLPGLLSSGAIVSRDDALAVGLKTYFTGKPCRHGHIAPRRVRDYICEGCEKTHRAEANGRRYALHADEISARNIAARDARRKARFGEDAPRTAAYAAAAKARWQDKAYRDTITDRKRRDLLERSPGRASAKDAGIDRYDVGKECPNGHTTGWWTVNGSCIGCKRERDRRWIAENADYMRSKTRAYRLENPEKVKAAIRRCNAARISEIRAGQRAYYLLHKDKINARTAAWLKENPDSVRAYRVTRRARIKASGGRFSGNDIKEIFSAQRGKCAWCRQSIRKAYDIDHVIPLAKGGSNARQNLQLLCPTCNRRKGAKDPIGFARENGRLL